MNHTNHTLLGRRAAIPALALLLGSLGACAPDADHERLGDHQQAVQELVELQFLTVSDWHAQLDPLSTPQGNVGGAAVLSAYFNADRAANPHTLTFMAGDSFGASPPLSGMFDEVPAILAMNLMGISADTLGNHNFDRGVAPLQSLVNLARFQFLSANLDDPGDELTGVAPWALFEIGGTVVGVVGITNPEAPTLVTPGAFGGITVTDPVPAANQARAAAQAAGAKVTICLTHMGVTDVDDTTGAPSGPLVDFANAVGGFDVIVGDHTDVQWSGVLNGHLVVQNRSKGLTYARVSLLVDPRNGRIADGTTQFVTPLASAVVPDPAIVQMLAPYRTALAAEFDRVIGVATALFPRGGNIERLREVAIGNLIADSMRLRYGTQLAFTNGGGIRAPLPSSYLPLDHALRRTTAGYAAGPPYDLVVGDIFTTLPFGNEVVVRTVTGTQLHAALEHAISALPGANGRFAQISGFRFAYDLSRPVGARVVSVALADGTPIPADGTTYSLTTNDFVNEGGDGYTMLADGQGVSQDLMAQVLLEYVEGLGTITPVIEGRIVNATP